MLLWPSGDTASIWASMVSFRWLSLALVALLSFALPAAAQSDSTPPDSAPKVLARLVAENGEVAPGGTVTIALEENIRDGWHTYWRNPGETGGPTELAWTLPHGWKVAPIQWPYPKRLPAGPLMQYGYEGKPWLLMKVTAPADAKPGDVVTLKAHASWLVCSATLCVPEDAPVSLDLAVVAQPAPPYATIVQQFDMARALIPVASPWPAHFQRGKTLDLFLAAPNLSPRAADFFPYEEGFIKGECRTDAGPRRWRRDPADRAGRKAARQTRWRSRADIGGRFCAGDRGECGAGRRARDADREPDGCEGCRARDALRVPGRIDSQSDAVRAADSGDEGVRDCVESGRRRRRTRRLCLWRGRDPEFPRAGRRGARLARRRRGGRMGIPVAGAARRGSLRAVDVRGRAQSFGCLRTAERDYGRRFPHATIRCGRRVLHGHIGGRGCRAFHRTGHGNRDRLCADARSAPRARRVLLSGIWVSPHPLSPSDCRRRFCV